MRTTHRLSGHDSLVETPHSVPGAVQQTGFTEKLNWRHCAAGLRPREWMHAHFVFFRRDMSDVACLYENRTPRGNVFAHILIAAFQLGGQRPLRRKKAADGIKG